MKKLILTVTLITISSCTPAEQTRAKLNAELDRILGAKIPDNAVQVRGEIMTMMTHTVNVSFSCSNAEFVTFWNSTPKLAAAKTSGEVDLSPDSQTSDFDSKWEFGGSTQFCAVNATTNTEGLVDVTIRTTHE